MFNREKLFFHRTVILLTMTITERKKKNKKERKKWTLFTGGMVPYVENAEGFTK